MSTTATISAADVNKLRQMTGAGMMDCKKALSEANGDFEAAIDNLRKKGQKVAANRADREAKEGYIAAGTNDSASKGYLVSISSETDFVSKNQDFVTFAESILDIVIKSHAKTIDEIKIRNFRMCANNRILIKAVIIIMPGPSAYHLYLFKERKTCG